MRRTIAIATAVVMLIGAAVAYGALNSYGTGTSFSFSPSKAGSAKSPSPLGFKQTLQAANANSSLAAAPLINIDSKVYGLVSNAKYFPTCSSAKIDQGPKFNNACPKGSHLATGRVNSLLGDPTLTESTRIKCNPYLDVYNGGSGKQWYFFSTKAQTDCPGLSTGATAAYEGFVKQQGKYLDTNVPLPPDISTKVANVNNFYGSLIHEVLTWYNLKTKVHGKTVGITSSVACLHGKRPWSVTYTATLNGARESKTVKGSSKC